MHCRCSEKKGESYRVVLLNSLPKSLHFSAIISFFTLLSSILFKIVFRTLVHSVQVVKRMTRVRDNLFWIPKSFRINIFPRIDMLGLDFIRLIMFIRWIESTILDIGDQMQKIRYRMCTIGTLGLRLVYRIMHLILSLWYFFLRLKDAVGNYLISCSLSTRYRSLNISKVQYLAIVIDSEEALETPKVLELLRLLAIIGLKNVCLYDMEGVLKKSKEVIISRLKSEKISEETTIIDPRFEKKHLKIEFSSFSDGKEAVAKAANFLFEKHYSSANMDKLSLKESDIAEALKAIGCGATEPNLMLIYGPVRCHLGFPAWRMSYTEIVHMGSLHSMNFGALVNAIYEFTMVRQNYGT